METLDLFLLVGQSNMVGRATIEPEDQIAIPRVWMLTLDHRWASAIDPLHFDRVKAPGAGLGRTFGKTIAAADPNVSIGLIPCAAGGTSIDQWQRGSELYNAAVARTVDAMKHGTVRAILWHQGESDLSAERPKAYLAKLAKLIAAFRTDLALSDVPFIAGQIGNWDPAAREFNDQLLTLPQIISNTACARATDLDSIGDETHFDSASIRELGRRYAIEYLKLT